MDAYTSFARVYDTFMDNIPYEEWAVYLTGLLNEYGVNDGLVLDLGCGTGNMTELLAKEGYDMIGVDNAEEMLEIAMEKREKIWRTLKRWSRSPLWATAVWAVWRPASWIPSLP